MLMADFRPLQFDILQNDQKKLQKFVDLSWNGELRIVLANYWTTLWISCLENLIVYSMFYVDWHGPGHNHIVYKLVTNSLCPFLPPPCYIHLQCYTQLTFGCEGRTNWSTRGVCVKFCRFSFLYFFDPTFFCNLALAFVWYQIVHVIYFSAKKHCPTPPPSSFSVSWLKFNDLVLHTHVRASSKTVSHVVFCVRSKWCNWHPEISAGRIHSQDFHTKKGNGLEASWKSFKLFSDPFMWQLPFFNYNKVISVSKLKL